MSSNVKKSQRVESSSDCMVLDVAFVYYCGWKPAPGWWLFVLFIYVLPHPIYRFALVFLIQHRYACIYNGIIKSMPVFSWVWVENGERENVVKRELNSNFTMCLCEDVLYGSLIWIEWCKVRVFTIYSSINNLYSKT